VRLAIFRALRRAELEVTVQARWHVGTSVEVTLPSDLGRCLWAAGCFEPNEMAFLASVLGPGMTFIDVGANIGLFTLLAGALVAPGGTLVAVEPSPREEASLRHNLAANGRLGTRIRTEALGRAEGTATLHVTDPVHAGHNTLGAPVYASTRVVDDIEVPVTTLDRLVDEEPATSDESEPQERSVQNGAQALDHGRGRSCGPRMER